MQNGEDQLEDREAWLEDLRKLADWNDDLIRRAKSLSETIKSCLKLEKKLRAEAAFFASVLEGRVKVKKEHLKGNNLQHLAAVIEFAEKNIVRVKSVERHYSSITSGERVLVDVVLNGRPYLPVTEGASDVGVTWIKVTERHRDAIRRIAQGNCGFGTKSIIDSVERLADVAKDNMVGFATPHLAVLCGGGVYDCVAQEIRRVGGCVVGEVVQCKDPFCCLHDEDKDSDGENSAGDVLPNTSHHGTAPDEADPAGSCVQTKPRVNLDVSTMICLVSELTHTPQQGSRPYRDSVVEKMSRCERADPVLPHLLPLLKDKELLACPTALASFRTIISTIAGPNEKRRAEELLARVAVIDGPPSDRCAALRPSARIKSIPQEVFGVGDQHRVVTISANSGFVRAARSQGVVLTVALHDSRALAEMAPRVDNVT